MTYIFEIWLVVTYKEMVIWNWQELQKMKVFNITTLKDSN